MESIGRVIAFSLCSILVSCTLHQSANTGGNQNGNISKETAPRSLAEKFGVPLLLDQLKKEQGIVEPFAWWGWSGKESGGSVIGIDQKNMLRTIDFVKAGDDYILKPSEYPHKLNTLRRSSGDLDLGKYLPDTEFPFESFLISKSSCNVHFVLVWEALNRSFERHSSFLDVVQLRIIVERNGAIVSNKLEKLLFDDLRQVLVEDVNRDGKPDLLLRGYNKSSYVRIWTVEEGCVVKPLLFEESGRLFEDAHGYGNTSLTKDQTSGTYEVHVTDHEPITKNGRQYFEYTETVYRWDSKESVYKVKKTRTWLEPAT